MAELQVNKVRRADRLALTDRPMTIGRSSENELVLPSKGVSRHHCVIELVDGETRIRDLGSRHGTRVNGQRVAESVLTPGDTIAVGSFEIIFRDGEVLPRNGAGNGVVAPETARERAAALDELREAVEHERNALRVSREDLQAARERHATELEDLTGRLSEAERRAEAESSRVRDLEAEAKELRDALETRRHEIEAETRELREAFETQRRESEAETRELREALETQRRESEAETRELREALETRQREMEDERRRASEFETRTGDLQEDLEQTRERASAADRRLTQVEQGINLLHAAAQRLASTQASLRAIEALWIEIDAQVRRAQQLGRQDPSDLLEREQLSEHLEDAHEEGDAAAADLVEIAERLHQLLNDERGSRRAMRRPA